MLRAVKGFTVVIILMLLIVKWCIITDYPAVHAIISFTPPTVQNTEVEYTINACLLPLVRLPQADGEIVHQTSTP